MFPCSNHGRRVKGPLGAVYVSAVRGTTRHSRRMRLCNQCLGEFLSTTGSSWIAADDELTGSDVPVCSACEKVEGGDSQGFAVFCTYYEPGQQRQDLFGYLHGSCADSFISGLGLETA